MSLLAQRLGPLVDLHGQHDHQALLSPATHVRCLDRYIGAPALEALQRYQEARAAFDDANRAFDDLAASLADAERQADYLRFVVHEIDAAAPEPDEDIQLERRLPSLRHAERLSAAAADAYSALRGDGGASDAVSAALAALDRVADLDPALDEVAARLAGVGIELDDVGTRIREYGSGIEHDPRALDEVQARMSTLAGLKKKYGPTLADVVSTRDQSEAQLEVLESSDQALASRRVAVE